MKIIEDVKYDFSDVLIMPKRSSLESRSQVTLEREYKFKHSSQVYQGIPICVANMDTTGTFEMAQALMSKQMSVALHKFYTVEQLVEYFSKLYRPSSTFYTLGITDSDLEKFNKVCDALSADNQPNYICVDVANGYSRKFVTFVERLRQLKPDAVIMAGNVVTPDMTYDLLERGADIVKIGIGSGSVCTTRKLTGVGFPQLSAVIECADAAHGVGGLICSDGGITCTGDISKAFGAGADFVMGGGIFAGHAECAGEIIGQIGWDNITETSQSAHDVRSNGTNVKLTRKHKISGDEQVIISTVSDGVCTTIKQDPIPLSFYTGDVKMKFYGMSSQPAMEKHYGGKAEYRASEGKVVEVPFKGPVKNTVEDILGGLRSTCTYVGASKLKDLSKCTTFVRVNRTLNESLSQYNV